MGVGCTADGVGLAFRVSVFREQLESEHDEFGIFQHTVFGLKVILCEGRKRLQRTAIALKISALP